VTTTRRTTKTEAAYEMLKQRITDGVYGPGYRLVIDQLARETGMSSIPWREAIRRLEAEGWLEMVPNVGARVAVFDTAAYGQTMQVLARLEGYATAAALPGLAAEDMEKARGLNQQMKQSLDDFDPVGFTALNRKFHFIFYERCGDPHLYNLIKAEWSRLDLIRKAAFSSVPGRARASVIEHDTLLDLLESSGPAETIETVARQHKLNTLDAVQANDAAQTAPQA
jgi:DNA-binding GntR family transcriptional regulator